MGLPIVVVTDLVFHEACNVLVAGTYGRGMYQISLEEGVASSIQPTFAPLALQAFPNPTKALSTLQFKLEKAGNFNLSIRNLQGSLVLPTKEIYLSPGTHELELTLGKLSTGLYLIELIEEEQAIRGTIKIIKH